MILNKTYYELIDDVVINKHNTIYTNDNIKVMENEVEHLCTPSPPTKSFPTKSP